MLVNKLEWCINQEIGSKNKYGEININEILNKVNFSKYIKTKIVGIIFIYLFILFSYYSNYQFLTKSQLIISQSYIYRKFKYYRTSHDFLHFTS